MVAVPANAFVFNLSASALPADDRGRRGEIFAVAKIPQYFYTAFVKMSYIFVKMSQFNGWIV